MIYMKKLNIVLFSTIFVFIISLSTVAEVSAAYSYTDVLAKQSRGWPDLSQCIHSYTGKLIKVAMDNSNIYVQIVSQSGTVQSVTVDVTPAGYTSQYSTPTTLDTDEILIFTVIQYKATPYYTKYKWHLMVTRLNIVSLAYTNYDITIETLDEAIGSGGEIYSSLSQIFQYNNLFSSMVVASYFTTGGAYHRMRRCIVEFDPSDNSADVHDLETVEDPSTLYALNPNIIGFQDMNVSSGQYCYLLFALSGNLDNALICRMDLSGATIEDIATFPYDGYYYSSRRLQNLRDGGGIYEDGADVYLYVTYMCPEILTGSAYENQVQYRLRFNCTDLTAANLQEQGYRYRHAIMSTSDATELWLWGYCEDKSTIYYYRMYKSPTTGIYTIGELRLSITTFTDMASQIWDTLESISDTVDSFPYDDKTDVIGRDPYGSFSVSEDGTNIRVFYGLAEFEGEYDLTLSYLPADTPLISEKTYIFTGTGYVNSIGVKHYQVWFIDGSQIGASATSASGVKQTSYSTNAGIHNITISMYSLDGSTYYYTESFLLSWQQAAAPAPGAPSGVMIVDVMNLIAKGLPALFVVMIPIVAVSRIKGLPPLVAIVSGLIIGVVVGTVSGLFPVYLTFLFILGIAITFVYMVNK